MRQPETEPARSLQILKIVPESDVVVVITSTNFGGRGQHEQTDRMLTEFVLGSLRH